jgi:PAS domain S-box-containing protein
MSSDDEMTFATSTDPNQHRNLAQHNVILELLATGASFDEILTAMVTTVELVNPTMICSIFLSDSSGNYLKQCAAPTLPDSFNKAIESIEIAPGIASCGAAAFERKRVIVEDVMTHPNWASLRTFAEQAGIRACWAEPIFSASGEILGALSIYYREPRAPTECETDFVHDIARVASIAIERRIAEDSLRQSEERYRSIFKNNLEAILVMDDNAKLIDANPAACKLLGYSHGELMDLHMWNITSFRNQIDGIQLWQDFMKTGTQSGEYQLTRKDGKTVPVEYRAEANLLPGQHLSMLRDITAAKQAQEEMRKHQSKLAHVARISTVGEMATGLAHEINQPLTAIINYARGCINRLKKNDIGLPEMSDSLSRIAEQAERAAEVIHNLRQFVSEGDLRGEVSDINRLINETLVLIQAEARQHEVRIHCGLANDLPEVMVDPIQIQQVVLNLIRNSIEALSTTDSEQRSITVKTSRNLDKEIAVEISDNGPGLDQEALDHLFEPFFTTKATGMGMGLAISQTIIETHGGLLSAVPNGGQGLSVQFTLPLERK